MAERFREDAMAIDPTIKTVWLGTDELTAADRGRIFSIVLDRGTKPPAMTSRPKASAVARAIKAHKKAWKEFEDCCNAADASHPEYGGASAERVWDRLNARETRALDRLLTTPARTAGELRAKAQYLLDGHPGRWPLEDRQWVLLLRSHLGTWGL